MAYTIDTQAEHQPHWYNKPIDRRTALATVPVTAAAAVALVPSLREKVLGYFKSLFSKDFDIYQPRENRYFIALRKEDRLYIQYDNKKFIILQNTPEYGRGVQKMVKTANPQYNSADLEIIGGLMEQLIAYENSLRKLEEGKPAKFIFESTKGVKMKYPRKYPTPQENSSALDLESLLNQK